jgi:protein TonB
MSQVISNDATLDDIIFRDKNREFGAFVLRSTYPKVIKRSVLLGSTLFVGALLLAAFWKQLTANIESKQEVTAEVMKLDTPPPAKKVELPPPPPPPPPKEIPKVTTTKFLPPEIKHDEEVTKPEPPPEEVKGNTASETVKGETENYEPPVDPDAKGKEEPVEPPKPAEDEIFTAVEQNAEFPGGPAAFGRYLQRSLKYPSAAQRANVGGKVYVQFVVNTDGSIQDVQVIKSVGFGCDEEAIRVIKSGPKWNPGKQAGRAVRSRFTQPITFQLSE